MIIVVFNVKYSNNVGDGIIAETTEYLLEELSEGSHIYTFDLGGRSEFGASGIRAPSGVKNALNKILKVIPEKISSHLRKHLTNIALKRDFLSLWREKIEVSDRVIIGGGHLISDAELYFLLRLRAIVQLAIELKKPIYLHAVGVSNPKYFSAMGRKIFFDTFNNNPYLHYVSVRDELSKEYWLNLFGGSVSVVPDPGNFAHEAYADVTSSDESVRVIGIGVMADDLVIKDTPGTHVKVALSIDDYMVLGNRLLELGYMPLYFTNGAPEDEVVLRGIKSIFPNSSQVKFAERPIIPADLVRIIRCCEKIVAHRLHACIVATSIGVPVIGLAWDKKLSSYFEGIGAVDRVCTDFEVDALVEKLLALEPVAIDFDKNSYIKLVS